MEYLAIGSILSLISAKTISYFWSKNVIPPVAVYYDKDVKPIVPEKRIDLLTAITEKKFQLKKATTVETKVSGEITLWDIRKKIQELRPIPERVLSFTSPIAKFEANLKKGKANLKPIVYK